MERPSQFYILIPDLHRVFVKRQASPDHKIHGVFGGTAPRQISTHSDGGNRQSRTGRR